MKALYIYITTIIAIITCSCLKIDDEQPIKVKIKNIENIDVPTDFKYQTSKTILLRITDKTLAKYVVSDDFGTLGTLFSSNEEVEMEFVVATSTQEISLKRTSFKDGTVTESQVQITQDIATYNHKNANKRLANEGCVDKLYAVNNQGGFYNINNAAGVNNTSRYQATSLGSLQGGGSIACALDQENNYVYYNVGRTMYRYNVLTDNFETVFTSNPFNGSYPRLEYKDGLFYMSNDQGKMYIVNASTNQIIQYYNIQGFINSKTGGDLAFASDGQLYLACFSGLYKFTSFDDVNEKAYITRISAENFPHQLTSMAIDRNDDIYVGTVDNNSRLLKMSIQDGSYEQVAQYNHRINDLTAWRCADEDIVSDDTDGDGVIDDLDAFPNDSTKASETFTPSELGWGSIAFEDLWPGKGDYDFNDLVVNYRFTHMLNAQNQTVESILTFKIGAINASYQNGFGIELPFDESLIASVTGSQLTEGALISLNNKGLEEGQNNPVIIVFDNAFEHGNYGECAQQPDEEISILITYVNPVDPSSLGSAPYNPFIFIDGNRSNEVHLSDKAPTSKVNTSLFGTVQDDSNEETNRYYKTATNLPFAIHIIHNFRNPRERKAINLGYTKFVEWAESGGTVYTDWYKDNSGYRNTQHLCLGN